MRQHDQWRQLSLLKGKRQKGELLPLAREFKTHVALAKALAVGLNPGWLANHFPAGELRDKATAGKLKAMGLKPGWPDFVLIDPVGTHYWLELKRGKAPLSEAQAAFGEAMLKRLVPWAVARSFDEAVTILTGWGALRLQVTA